MLQEGAQFRILDLLELEQHFTTNGPVRKSFSRRPTLALLQLAKRNLILLLVVVSVLTILGVLQ